MNASLVCPISRLSITQTSPELARQKLGGDVVRVAHGEAPSCETPDEVLLRSDNRGFYPIIAGVPILMAPEMLAPAGTVDPIDTSQDPYREAYEEMDFYDNWANRETCGMDASPSYQHVKLAIQAGRFPQPGWLDATYDSAAQLDAYAHIAPIEGQRILQVGGKGTHAVKFLVAGASEAWLATPMLGEALFARDLAAAFGVEHRLKCVVAIGEELPFVDACFDRVYTGSCLHHTITPRAIPEIARVLVSGGRFAAVEPWRAPLYGIGTKVLGKREVGVNCRPIDPERAKPLYEIFACAAVSHHGALTRYPLLALHKLGIRPPLEAVQRITAVDDRLSSLFGPLRQSGSSVALLGTK